MRPPAAARVGLRTIRATQKALLFTFLDVRVDEYKTSGTRPPRQLTKALVERRFGQAEANHAGSHVALVHPAFGKNTHNTHDADIVITAN